MIPLPDTSIHCPRSMKNIAWRNLPLCLCLLAATISPAFPVDPPNPPFTVGAATRDITPEKGVSINGSISKRGLVTGMNDPLFARALVIGDGKESIAIAIVDACLLGEPVFEIAHRQVTESTGIPLSHQVIAATHTHAGPRSLEISRRSEKDDRYHRSLARKIAEAIVEAHESAEPASVRFHALAFPELVANRRFRIEPGTAGPNPFGDTGETVASIFRATKKNKITGPAGPTDPAFRYLYAERPDGSPLAVLGNFSVHYCGGYSGGIVSADYFGAFCRHLEKRVAESSDAPFVALQSNGTSGDIGTLRTPPSLGKRKFRPYERGEAIGAMLADAVFEDLFRSQPVQGARVQATRAELDLGVRKPSPERLEWARGILAKKTEPSHPRTSAIYAEEAVNLAEYPDTVTLPVSVLDVGGLRIAASPCETFAETGLALQEARPDAPTFTIELANGYGGYLPTPEQHRFGGYETWPARSSYLEEQAEPAIRARLIELLQAQ